MKFSFVGKQHKLSTGQTGISADVIFSLGSIFADCNREGAKIARYSHLSAEECGFREQMGKWERLQQLALNFDKPVLSCVHPILRQTQDRVNGEEGLDVLRKTGVRNP